MAIVIWHLREKASIEAAVQLPIFHPALRATALMLKGQSHPSLGGAVILLLEKKARTMGRGNLE